MPNSLAFAVGSGKRARENTGFQLLTPDEREVLHPENICERRQRRHLPSVNGPINPENARILAFAIMENYQIMVRILEFTDSKTLGKSRIFRLVNTTKCKQMPRFA